MLINELNKVFQKKNKNILSIFFTAGYPKLTNTGEILKALDNEEYVDFIEVGMPFSDPLAEGLTIQKTSEVALNNGMNIPILLDQIQEIKDQIKTPLILMGYYNPAFQYGMKKLCEKAQNCGINGIILPDLPLEVFKEEYEELFMQHNLHFIFLVTPQTPENRIRQMDKASGGFLYAVSSATTTGSIESFSEKKLDYFKYLKSLNLKNPIMAGFAIHDHKSFQAASQYTKGAIIGSAFLRTLELEKDDIVGCVQKFVNTILHPV